MKIIKFRSSADHKAMLHKIKKMKRFVEDLEECFEDMTESDDEEEYRHEYEEDEEMYARGGGRYRRGRM